MTSIGIRNISSFDFLEPPDPDAIQSGIRQLILLDALSPDVPGESKALTNGLSNKYGNFTRNVQKVYVS
jgi:HrpA-like RNA helicase